jgi:hypothetical protein
MTEDDKSLIARLRNLKYWLNRSGWDELRAKIRQILREAPRSVFACPEASFEIACFRYDRREVDASLDGLVADGVPLPMERAMARAIKEVLNTMSWREVASMAINVALDQGKLLGLEGAALEKYVRANGYPFGVREMHPYKIWCSEVNRVLKKPKKQQAEDLSNYFKELLP